jgi:hypothetical protein
MQGFNQVMLTTGEDGRARFVDRQVSLDQGNDQVRLSDLLEVQGVQMRQSPVGFRSAVHCTEHPQWVIVLSGTMEIGLADGSVRRFAAGQHFFANDILPEDSDFDPDVHGHWSRQVGDKPLETLFVRA